MDRQRAPQKTRRLTPSQPLHHEYEPDDGYRARAARPSPANNNSRRARGYDGMRRFAERVRDFTGRMPLVGQVTGYRRSQRRVDDGWRRAGFDARPDDNWNARPDDSLDGNLGGDSAYFNDAPGPFPPDDGDFPPGGFGGANEHARPAGSRERSGRRGSITESVASITRIRHISIKLVMVLALVSVIVGFCCTQSTLTAVDAAAAAADARSQVSAIQNILRNGNPVDVGHLTEMQTRLVTLNGDLVRIQSALPGPVVNTNAGESLNHTLTMATYLVQAGRYGVDAALILVPHLKGALSDVGSSSAATASKTPGVTPEPTKPTSVGAANTTTGSLTLDDVTRAQNDIAMAGALAQRALAERQYVNDQQLSRIGLGSVVSILHKMDALAPKLPTYLGYANSVVSALPDLLGVTKPAHFLLFDIDSDELRPTGGFMGNYALITVQNGRIVGGVHLKDTFAFDCPGGEQRCIDQGPPIPDQYKWMNAFPESFRMRDSNISPDFPTSAKLIMEKYQQESGQTVDGIIMITPEIIKDILKVTGPIKISGFDQDVSEVNENNLQDVIHYYHILNRNNFTKVNGNSAKKAIDTELGSALLHDIGTLSAAKQAQLVRSILAGFGTKDVQVYFNDSRIESVLETLHMASSIPMPPGLDGLMVTDTDTGATYYSRDIQESVTDTITFDSQGNAVHDMTISYKLPPIKHLYTSIYVDNYGNQLSWYTEVLRVFVPEGSMAVDGTGTYLLDGSNTTSAIAIQECNISTLQQISPCYVFSAPEPGYTIWAARINNMQVGTDNVIFHLQWITPKVMKTVDGKKQYNLQIYRQAGSHVSYDITILPPKGQQIAQPLTAPLKTAKGMPAGTGVEFTSPSLIKDTLLTVTFTGG